MADERFSQRQGLRPVRDSIQVESMDDDLRNGLWNVLQIYCWDHVHQVSTTGYGGGSGYYLRRNEEHHTLCHRLWGSFFKKPLDELSNDWRRDVLPELRSFFFTCDWCEAYDFVEFVANNFDRYRFREFFPEACNACLEREMSAYRFIDGKIAQITSAEAIAAFEQAVDDTSTPVATHLTRALELLSDRTKPDYRNSVKESISAIEALAIDVTDREKAGIGDLLQRFDLGELHPALTKAFSALYGYTSDDGGIRHALTDSASEVRSEDATFMLVACSAFVNLARAKTANAAASS